MTDTIKLKCAMLLKGYTIAKMAEAMNLSYYGFYKKLNNKSDFKSTEITKAIKILGITSDAEKNEIFFATDVDEMET